MSDHGVLLAPRLTEELPEDGLTPSARQLAERGRVATDLIGISGSREATRFLRWWRERLESILGALDGSTLGHGRADRQWVVHRFLELGPGLFSAGLLDGPGDNLSAWNLHEHQLEQAGDVILVDDGRPLRLMHFDGFDPTRPYRLSADASRVRISRSPALRFLTVGYAAELLAASWKDSGRRRDVGRPLANGLIFDERLQALYAIAQTLGVDLGEPFSAAGTQAFMDWLRGPAPRGGTQGVNRYVYQRVMRERLDVVAAFPDLNGGDAPGLVSWCHSSGVTEMGIPEQLMPESIPAGQALTPDREPGGADAGPPSLGAPSLGVRVSGYLGHVLGLGAAARGYAQALTAASVPLSTVTTSLDHLRPAIELIPEYGMHAHEDLVHEAGHAFELICVNPDDLPEFIDRVGHSYFHGKRIGVWGWETNRIPERWATAFELVDEIWVYSRFVAENLAVATDVPVLALPPPVLAPQPPAPPDRLGLSDDFLFLFVFDYSSTVQRKNPVGLIEAFREAFGPGEGPQLLIKTINAPLLPLAEEEVLWAADGRSDIHVIDRSLSPSERDSLMAGCDCYVSLHRSEGFGLTMAGAMSIGKPVIATAYSGNVDFMTPENSFLVDHGMTRVGGDVQIYPADGEWAEPSVEHAARLMRQVYDDPDGAARIGARAQDDIARWLSPEMTGAAMRRRLQALAQGADGLSA
jgi:glycosyltransferase involved in cell wall biosynthesis